MKLYQGYTKKPYSYLVNDIIRKFITIHEKLILKRVLVRKIKQSIKKSWKTKLNMISANKIPRFLLYIQQMLINMSFWQTNMCFIKKQLARKSCYNEKNWIFSVQYSQIDIAKKRYQGLDKFFISNKDDKDVNLSSI